MDTQKIQSMINWMADIGNQQNWTQNQIHRMVITNTKNKIIRISEDIKNEYPYFSDELFRLKDMLFIGFGYINPAIFGQIYAILKTLQNDANNPKNDFWNYIHPRIIKASKGLFQNGHYANAAEDAFIEINDRVKKIHKKLQPDSTENLDGVDLMNKMFSEKTPIMEICERETTTGKNIHNGTRFMLAGAISALRNPKAHSNDEELSPEEAMRRLMFASMLMHKIDEAVIYSGVAE